MVVGTCVSEFNRNISSYGVISFLGKQADLENKLHLITPGQKLKFNMKKDFYQNKTEFQLGKVDTKKLFNMPQDNVLNFGILCRKKNKTIGEKRKIQYEIVDSIHILGFQDLDNYFCLNPIEITIDSNSIIKTSSRHKKFKFRFIIESLLFSTKVQNNTEVIFVACDGLTEAKSALINSKLCKTLGVVYLSEIKNWDLIKNDSKRAQAVFVDFEHHLSAFHFAFAFAIKNMRDLLNFTVTLLDGSGNKITFPSDETKVPTLSFKVQMIK